jgi:predicted Rossmann fold nucleotide-binding protein DprA/Smf involved in DNA uptake
MPTDRKGHRRIASRNTIKEMDSTRTPVPKSQTRQGIKRHPHHLANPRPLSDTHLAILGALNILGPDPVPATVIARELGLKRSTVSAGLYVLQVRGKAQRIPFKGWVYDRQRPGA